MAAAAAALAVSLPASGEEEFSFSLRAGATYSDNITRAAVDEESETSFDLGVRMGFARDEGRLWSNLAADLEYRTYNHETYEDEVVGGLDGILTYWFVPERFSWIVQDNFGQTFTDPRAVETPDNRQNTNYFSTGPDVLLPLGGRTALLLRARFSDAAYERTDTDNQRLSGTLGLERQLGPRTSVSLNGTAERVEYEDEALNSNYDRQSAYVGFEAEGARTALGLQAGYTALHDFGDTTDGPLLDLSVSRRLTSRSMLALNAGTHLTDTANAFRRDQSLRGVILGSEDTIVSHDPFQSDFATLAWTLERARSTIRLAADWRAEDHERDVALDRESLGARLTVSRQLRSTLSAALHGAWQHEDFDESGIDFDEWSAGVGFGWSFARNLAISLRGDHIEGSGDTPLGAGLRDYTENRVSVAVTFAPRR